jgi:hypothetical protein
VVHQQRADKQLIEAAGLFSAGKSLAGIGTRYEPASTAQHVSHG